MIAIPYDVAVVGAGPAGSATAALLARRGMRVVLLERARFPRPKPCAEYLSPEASRSLDRLGALAAVEAAGPARLAGMRVVSPGGVTFVGRFLGAHRFRGYRDHGLALPRTVLDAELARVAVRSGAELREATVVDGIARAADGVALTLRRGARRSEVRARMLVGADGLNSRVARWMDVVRRGRRRRIALVTHARGVADMTDLGEMHVSPIGYIGLAPVGGGLANVAVVADLDRAPPARPPERWFRRLIATVPAVEQRLRGATLVAPIRAAGPFARWTARATGDRVALVGDAADFYDPFTGEGIYAALKGAELLSDHLAEQLARDRLSAAALEPYDLMRRHAFGRKWIVERLVSWVVAHPRALNRAARRLADRPPLADLLVGVTGDFIPASRILRPSYLWQLVR